MNILELLKRLAPIVGTVLEEITKRPKPRRKEVDAGEDLEEAGPEPESDEAEESGKRPAELPRELPRVMDVKAATWLNQSDDRNGATAQQPAYPWAPRYHNGVGRTLFAASVPMKVSEGDKLRIRRVRGGSDDPGPWYLAPIIDKGPHNVTDEYLLTGDRPAAESEEGNKAGVDCTPPLMAKLLDIKTEDAYLGEYSCVVEVQLVRGSSTPSKAPTSSQAQRAVDAARALPKPFAYAPETNAGELGCAQVISTAMVNARLLKRVRLRVADLRKDLEAAGWRKVGAGQPLKPGDVVVWGPTKTGTHKHVGLITSGSPGPIVLHNSSAERRVVERPLTTVSRPVEAILRMP